jgi:hypothetical protein
MAKKTVWHTDIVVDGRGIGLKVSPTRGGCYRLEMKADVPGKTSDRAKNKFMKAMNSTAKACSPSSVKAGVERAVRKTKARWNKWHREAYD